MRYYEIKQALREAEILDEVSMSPSALERFANSPEAEGMLMGVEFEMVVPDASAGDDDYDLEPDYSVDQSAHSISNIIDFFRDGEFSNLGRSDAEQLSNRMWDQFLEWQWEKISDDLDEDELLSRVRDRLSEDLDVDDYVDEARDELGDDASDSAVEDRAQELLDSALDEMMSAGTNDRDYERAYDSIREEMTEEMRYTSDYDEEAWLSDIGVDSMQEAESEFGLQWPHLYNPNEGDGRDISRVVEEFTEGTGYRAVGYSGYHTLGSRSDQQRQGHFIIEPDGSIDKDSGEAGLEFVSPAMPLKDGLEMIKRVTAWAKDYGCYTNKSTGLHMNISVPDMTTENLDYVKLALFLGDEYVLKEFDRQYNTFTSGAMKIVREKIKQNPENATALLAKMKKHLNTAASKLVHNGITQKYTSINTKGNYVEFRGPGGDYLDQDITKLVSTALRLAQSLRIATDESAYKQEYAKKLYKLVSPEGEWTDPNNSVALFSRYALGEIDKAELVNNVRQAQTARREKKAGPEKQYWVANKDGTGGKQMVYARSDTEAIIKGGAQIGLNREQSINRLAANLVYNQKLEMPASVPNSWQMWIRDSLPNADVDQTINPTRSKLVGDSYEVEPDAKAWLLQQIDNELRRRMGVEGNETRWQVRITRGEYENNTVYVDADTPRQAKLKAVNIFQRSDGINVDIENLEAIATTQNTSRLSNDELAAAAGRAENEAYASLPQQLREFLDDIEDKSDMGLINILRNPTATEGLSEQGAAYFRIRLRRELRRRGINPDGETEPSQANVSQDVVPNYEIYDTESGQVISQFRADTEEEANRKFSEFEQNYHSDSDFSHEYRAIGPRQPTQPVQLSLDLREMRRLAGLTS
jgi:hypothetical protein